MRFKVWFGIDSINVWLAYELEKIRYERVEKSLNDIIAWENHLIERCITLIWDKIFLTMQEDSKRTLTADSMARITIPYEFSQRPRDQRTISS